MKLAGNLRAEVGFHDDHVGLLLETSLSIAEIAEIVGFSTQNYFEHQFKRLTGQSPRQFAAQNRR